MSEQLLDFFITYGVVALVPVIVAAAVGLPLPATFLLLAAGAFAGGGQFSLPVLIVGGIVAACLGDGLGYLLGRRGGAGLVARWGPPIGLRPDALARAEQLLERWGGVAIVSTRCLITPLGPVVNVVAGTTGYPYRRFLLYDAIGEAIWVVLYVGLGYTFGANWELLVALATNATWALTLLVIVGVLLFLLVRALLHRHHEHQEQQHAHDDTPAHTDEPGAEGLGASATR